MSADIFVTIDQACQANCPSVEQVEQWLATALSGLCEQGEIAVRIVDEIESAELNSQYRGKDYATNVLSFPSGMPLEMRPAILGDLAICAAVVEREAREQNKTIESHWAHLYIHGALHLLGFDHIDDDEAEEMEALEIEIMAKLGFANPYREE